MRPHATPNDPDGLIFMWRITLVMHACAAAALGIVLLAPDPDTSDHTALAIVAGLQVVLGTVVWLAGPRPAVAWFTPLQGVLCVTVLTAVARPIGATPYFYLLPILVIAYHHPPRVLHASLAGIIGLYGGALALFAVPGERMVLFLGSAVAFAIVGVTVGVLRTRLDRLIEELQHSASTDPLTGLLNRRAFDSAFERECERAHRAGTSLAVALFDLDHFKRVNDRHGHARGDAALVRFAALLTERARRGDVVARIGGEEFGVLLPATGEHGARTFAEHVVGELAEATAGEDVPLTTSAGVAVLGRGLPTRDALLRAADAALYRAKDEGRDRVVVHDDDATPALR